MNTRRSTKQSTSAGQLAGRVAVISGGAQGIGREIAAVFQREGARIFILDCDAKQGQKTAQELTKQIRSAPVRFIRADLRHPSEVQSAIEAMRELEAKVDILVNNAGIEVEKSLENLSVSDWDLILEVNLRGAFLLTQAVLPFFRESDAAIVNISSIHASHAFPDSIPYACSKAGLVALTRNLALELAPRHIRVNCICPGYIDTRLWAEYLRNSPDPKGLADRTTALHPLGRRGVPVDIGEAVLFFASTKSSFITGASVVVDGGLTLRAHS